MERTELERFENAVARRKVMSFRLEELLDPLVLEATGMPPSLLLQHLLWALRDFDVGDLP